MRFDLRLTETLNGEGVAISLNENENPERLTQLSLDLLLNECAAYGSGSSDCINRSHIEYIRLERAEQSQRSKKSHTSFSSIFNDAAALEAMTPTNVQASLIQTQKTVWFGIIVIHFYTEATAQYIASHINGLTTNKE